MVLKGHSSKLHQTDQTGAHQQVTGSSNGTLITDANLAPAEDSTAHGPCALRSGQLWCFSPCQQGTNVNQAKFADIFWRSWCWWANQNLSPLLWYFPCDGSGSNGSREGKMGTPGYRFPCSMGNLLTIMASMSISNQIPDFKCLEINLKVWNSKRYFQYNNFKQKKLGKIKTTKSWLFVQITFSSNFCTTVQC